MPDHNEQRWRHVFHAGDIDDVFVRLGLPLLDFLARLLIPA